MKHKFMLLLLTAGIGCHIFGQTSLLRNFVCMVQQGSVSGSGFLFRTEDGRLFVFTNHHVVDSDELPVRIIFDKPDGSKPEFKAQIIATDKANDLALLAPEDTDISDGSLRLFAAVPEEGDEVYTSGFPGSGGNPQYQLGHGIVSNARAQSNLILHSTLLRHTGQVHPGNSGGPLLIRDTGVSRGWGVVGINTLKGAGDGVAYAVPAKTVFAFFAQILEREYGGRWEYEPNDQLNNANSKNMQDTVKGAFQSPEDADCYKIVIPKGGGNFTAEVRSRGLIKLNLYNAQKELIASNSGSGTLKVSAKISGDTSYSQEPVYVEVKIEEPYYEIYALRTWIGVEPDRFEQHDAPVPVALDGSWIPLSLHSQDDEDWFVLSVPPDRDILLETGGDTDTVIELHRTRDGSALVTRDDDGGNKTNGRLKFRNDEGETRDYFVKVKAHDHETGSYRLRALQVIHEIEPANDTYTGAGIISPGIPLLGSLRSSDNGDWYKISVPDCTFTAYTEGEIDTTITLYNGNGLQRIAYNDDMVESKEDLNFNAGFSIKVKAGTLYLHINSPEGLKGNYGEYLLFVNVH
jgi:hypothetical protein